MEDNFEHVYLVCYSYVELCNEFFHNLVALNNNHFIIPYDFVDQEFGWSLAGRLPFFFLHTINRGNLVTFSWSLKSKMAPFTFLAPCWRWMEGRQGSAGNLDWIIFNMKASS